MSDVELGGATVFPKFEVILTPKKGAAAFWYNLYPNGESDQKTEHGACPVLIGEKWGMITNGIVIDCFLIYFFCIVSNKWINERGQEFRRPCSLSYDVQ